MNKNCLEELLINVRENRRGNQKCVNTSVYVLSMQFSLNEGCALNDRIKVYMQCICGVRSCGPTVRHNGNYSTISVARKIR